MKKLLCLVLAAAMLFCVPVSAGAAPEALAFGDDGKFVILHISDPQDDRYAAYDPTQVLMPKAAEKALQSKTMVNLTTPPLLKT